MDGNIMFSKTVRLPRPGDGVPSPGGTRAGKIGRYLILEELGHGAIGVVYRACDPRIGRTVAIKQILGQDLTLQGLEQYRRRF